MWVKAKAGPLASSNSKIYLILFAPQYTVKNNLLPQVYLFKWKKKNLYYLFWEKSLTSIFSTSSSSQLISYDVLYNNKIYLIQFD